MKTKIFVILAVVVLSLVAVALARQSCPAGKSGCQIMCCQCNPDCDRDCDGEPNRDRDRDGWEDEAGTGFVCGGCKEPCDPNGDQVPDRDRERDPNHPK